MRGNRNAVGNVGCRDSGASRRRVADDGQDQTQLGNLNRLDRLHNIVLVGKREVGRGDGLAIAWNGRRADDGTGLRARRTVDTGVAVENGTVRSRAAEFECKRVVAELVRAGNGGGHFERMWTSVGQKRVND